MRIYPDRKLTPGKSDAKFRSGLEAKAITFNSHKAQSVFKFSFHGKDQTLDDTFEWLAEEF
jgi:hypothetical protein